MNSRRWISAAVLAASSSVLPGLTALAQTPPAPASTPIVDATIDPQLLVDRDLAQLNARLTRAAAGMREDLALQQRQEVAGRLLTRTSPKAVQYLLDALQNPAVSHDVKLAVARAIADAPHPDPVFAAALLPLLDAERALSDAAARALVHFGDNPRVRQRLIATAENIGQPIAVRASVIHAMASIVSRDTASALVALVADPRQPPAIQNTAADALADLTGQYALGRDGAKWTAWRNASANKPDVVWQADVLASQANRAFHTVQENNAFVEELKQVFQEQYDRADRPTKFVMVMRLLDSPESHTRAMGVQLVIDAQASAAPFPPGAPRRIEELVGDANPGVRLIVAQAIKSINDTDALTALLTQLPQETDPAVRQAQVAALSPMKSLKAVPELRLLLRDPSPSVATAAVEALRALAPLLLDANPSLAKDVAGELWQIGNARKNEPGGIEFRAAAIETAGALHDRELARDVLGLLSIDNDERTRSAALHALASIGDRATSFQIAQWLQNEPLPSVRKDAIRALGATSRFEDAADTLYRFMGSNTEPDKAVQEAAWNEFQSLLPMATNVSVLNRWASDFQNDPNRRLTVLLNLDDKLQQSMSLEDLAASRQNTGETYLALNDPARAAIQFSQALDYWQSRKVANQVTVQLIKQLLESHLAARDYDKAAEFAARQITLDPSLQNLVASTIVNEANRLYDVGVHDNSAARLRDALSLIDNALKMKPPLVEHYQADLRQFQQDATDKLKTIKTP